jgi:transposase-like protein
MYALIRKWEESGLTQENFFHQHGIPKSTFAYWRKKYLKEPGQSNGKNSFIPVKVDNATIKSQQVIELVYPNEVRLACSADTELSRLKSLIVL